LAASIAISGFGVAEKTATLVGTGGLAILLAWLLWRFRLEIAGELQQTGSPAEETTPVRKPVLWYIAQAYVPVMGAVFFALLVLGAFPKGILSPGQAFVFIGIPAWLLYVAVFFMACEIPRSGPPRFRPRTTSGNRGPEDIQSA
jgi:hypothetical protein